MTSSPSEGTPEGHLEPIGSDEDGSHSPPGEQFDVGKEVPRGRESRRSRASPSSGDRASPGQLVGRARPFSYRDNGRRHGAAEHRRVDRVSWIPGERIEPDVLSRPLVQRPQAKTALPGRSDTDTAAPSRSVTENALPAAHRSRSLPASSTPRRTVKLLSRAPLPPRARAVWINDDRRPRSCRRWKRRCEATSQTRSQRHPLPADLRDGSPNAAFTLIGASRCSSDGTPGA
jgi:hypothetical protein